MTPHNDQSPFLGSAIRAVVLQDMLYELDQHPSLDLDLGTVRGTLLATEYNVQDVDALAGAALAGAAAARDLNCIVRRDLR